MDIEAQLDSSLDFSSITNSANNEATSKSEFDTSCKYGNDDTSISKSESVLDSPGDCNNNYNDTGVSKSEYVLDSPRDCNNCEDSANGVKSESVLVADVSASSTSTTDSFVQTFDRKTCDHLDGAFLEVEGIIRVLAENKKPLEYIPDGVKENVYFVIKKGKNIMTRGRKNPSNFRLEFVSLVRGLHQKYDTWYYLVVI